MVDLCGLSPQLSQPTYTTAYALFTPSKSGQRSPPTYYRGCWHVVSRGLFAGYRLLSSPAKGLYIPKDFLTHAASLRQAFAHCAIFLIAASRRSRGRVSVPVRRIILSDPLPVVALVSRYLTNKLIGRRPIFQRVDLRQPFGQGSRRSLAVCGISRPFERLSPTGRQVVYVLLDRSPLA